MNNKQKLFEYLKSQKIMSLATFGGKLTICTVYYAIDDDWNFYFISGGKTDHSKNILKNSVVACNVVDSSQPVTSKKIGAQIEGVAVRLNTFESIKAGLKYWNQMNTGVEDVINIENIEKKIISSRVWKIKPTKIKFFNERLYKDEESKVFKF